MAEVSFWQEASCWIATVSCLIGWEIGRLASKWLDLRNAGRDARASHR